MKQRKLLKVFLDLIEIYIPALFFLIVFLSFLVGIVFRYIVKNPQSWTYEVSTIAFVYFVFLSKSLPNRLDEQIVFDLFYNKMSEKKKNICRVITDILIVIMACFLFKPSLDYLVRFKGLTTQIITIPRFLIFLSFPLMLINTIMNSIVFFVKDIKSLVDKSYTRKESNYWIEK